MKKEKTRYILLREGDCVGTHDEIYYNVNIKWEPITDVYPDFVGLILTELDARNYVIRRKVSPLVVEELSRELVLKKFGHTLYQ